VFDVDKHAAFLPTHPVTIRVGISGFRYTHWRGLFYPEGLAQRHELAYASSHLGSIEINGSFYSLQKPAFYSKWLETVPRDYVFAVKGGRFITHMKKLRDVEAALANFFGSGVLCLGKSLGPILWQFPENMPCDLPRFERFFELLPRTGKDAAALVKRHHSRPFEPAALQLRAAELLPLRHAIEIRNPACFEEPFMALLRKHKIAWVIADTAGRFPFSEEVTADFVYVRLHGDEQLYASDYSPKALARWAERIEAWSQGSEPADAVRIRPAAKRRARDVYVYFDNDGSAYAPHNAVSLQAALIAKGLPCAAPSGSFEVPPTRARKKAIAPTPPAKRKSRA
jgi:uncharacterized protein YecE (DUF72 family)